MTSTPCRSACQTGAWVAMVLFAPLALPIAIPLWLGWQFVRAIAAALRANREHFASRLQQP